MTTNKNGKKEGPQINERETLKETIVATIVATFFFHLQGEKGGCGLTRIVDLKVLCYY